MEGVVEGAQVGVDLVGEAAGKEAEVLAGLDGGAGEDDARDALAGQGVDGLGHGQVGLAGAGGADAEGDRGFLDGVGVGLLAEGLGADGAAVGGEDVVGEDLGGAGGGLQQADGALDGVRGQGRAGAGDVDELGEQDDDGVDAGGGAGDGDGGAAHVDVDVSEALLDGAQDLVPGAQEGHRGDVLGQGEGARDVRRFGGGRMGGSRVDC